MATTAAQRSANRANAKLSTGPKTPAGKQTVARNALQHGLLAAQPVLDHEDPAAYAALVTDLATALRPVGVLEQALVERIALALWRQQRLAKAETATLQKQLEDRQVAKQVSYALTGGYDSEAVMASDLAPLAAENVIWYRQALAELNALDPRQLTQGWPQLEQLAPLIYADLIDAADAAEQTVADYLTAWGGLAKYLRDMADCCQRELKNAEQRPQILALAALVRDERALLPGEPRERLMKYQVQLDNALSKALRTFRETQQWRLATLEAVNDKTGFVTEISAPPATH